MTTVSIPEAVVDHAHEVGQDGEKTDISKIVLEWSVAPAETQTTPIVEEANVDWGLTLN